MAVSLSRKDGNLPRSMRRSPAGWAGFWGGGGGEGAVTTVTCPGARGYCFPPPRPAFKTFALCALLRAALPAPKQPPKIQSSKFRNQFRPAVPSPKSKSNLISLFRCKQWGGGGRKKASTRLNSQPGWVGASVALRFLALLGHVS